MSVDLRIVPVEQAYPLLDRFADINLYHTPPWHRLLRECLGWPVRACIGYRDAEPLVYFPFVRKRRLGRLINVCLPLSHRVGPVWTLGVKPEPLSLRSTLWPVELHDEAQGPGLTAASAHQISVLDLAPFPDEDALFAALHKNNIQRKIRQANKAEISVLRTQSAADFIEFEQLQTLTRQRQGAPTYPAGFFPLLAKELATQGHANLFLGRYRDRAVAGVVFLYHGDTATYAYGASLPDRELWKLGVNQLAMWHAVRDAFHAGFGRVDFGSSPNAQPALREYKERFGAKSRPLIHTTGNDRGTARDIDQSGALVNLGGTVLRRLPPPLFRALSPMLLKAVL